MDAASELVLIARPELGTLYGTRVVSFHEDGTFYTEESAGGLRVGTGPNEIRMALTRPAFTQNVAAYAGWDVTEVSYQIAGESAVLSEPLRFWGGNSIPEYIYSTPHTPISTAYIRGLFQRLLDSAGNYASTTGIMVSSERPLPLARPVDITFLVTIRDPRPFEVNGLALVENQVGAVYFSWRSSRRGYADIYVNGVRYVSSQFTVADRVNVNNIYDDWLQAGTNEVYVVVNEPEDLASTAQSEIMTIAR